MTQAEGGRISPSTTSVAKGSDKTFTIAADEGYRIADVQVDGRSVGAVDSYTFEDVTARHTIAARFEKMEETAGVAGFVDVKDSDWFAEAVQYAVDAGLMKGTSATTFSPALQVSRAMLMTMLARMDGAETDGGSTWYEKGMAWAMAEGVSDGTNPNADITREQLVTMLYRYAGSPVVNGSLSDFSDAASVSNYAENAMQWAVANGIVNGSNGKLNPQNNATRAQVAAILMRFCEMSK